MQKALARWRVFGFWHWDGFTIQDFKFRLRLSEMILSAEFEASRFGSAACFVAHFQGWRLGSTAMPRAAFCALSVRRLNPKT